MARIDIKRFKENKIKNSKSHTLIEGEYSIIEDGKNGKLLQIDTFGSDERKISGKVSQSIQLDQQTLEQIIKVYEKEFKNR